MNRRDLMKGIAALPVAAAAYNVSCRKEDTAGGNRQQGAARSPRTKLYVALRGPFGVVVQSNFDYRIQAFVPIQEDHLFFFNNAKQIGSSYYLQLSSTGFNPSPPLLIDNFKDFQDFSAHTSGWKRYNYYITVDLPCPSDMLTDEIDDAVFQSGKPGGLPLTHIFEYDVNDIDQVRLKGSGIDALPMKDSRGLYFFDLEVGLPLNTYSTGQVLQHSVEYHNDYLLPCFPDVKGKELKSITLAAAGKRTSPINFSTDVECKNGGLLISFPQ